MMQKRPLFVYGVWVSGRRQQRRAAKARRHPAPAAPGRPVAPGAGDVRPRVVVREASAVERLAYTRSQAAEALGISRSTLRRLLPYVDTIEMPWGTTLIPVDELERLLAERRRAGCARRAHPPGRRVVLALELEHQIRSQHAAGASLGQIARDLNAAATPTAHGGAQWWPSTVRSVIRRTAEHAKP
jgi:hypothetical protein